MSDVVKTYAVLYPDLRKIYLNRAHGTYQMEYLALSERITRKELDEDIGNGAVRFKSLQRYLDRKKKSTYVLVTAPAREDALMAIAYLAAIDAGERDTGTGEMNVWDTSDEEEIPGAPKSGDATSLEGVTADIRDEGDADEGLHADFEDDPGSRDDNFNNETWHETRWQVPVVPGHQAVIRFGTQEDDSALSFGLGGFQMQGSSPGLSDNPPWTVCRHEPVIVDLGDCLHMSSPETISSAVEYFNHNQRVYLMLTGDVREEELDLDEEEYYDLPFGDSFAAEERTYERLRSTILLDYLADEVRIPSMTAKERTRYFSAIAKGNAMSYGMNFAENFPFGKLLNAAILSTDYTPCLKLYKVIRYACVRKLQEKTRADHLTLSDFSFIDRYADMRAKSSKDKSTKTALEHLDGDFVGMESVKKQVKDIITLLRYEQQRKKAGFDRDVKTHNVFLMLGAPGTAKSSVARIMGQIMNEERLLSDNRFISISGAEMKGMYVGHTAPKIHQLFRQYDILFIDEAYGLAASDGKGPDTFSQEGLAQLCVELEDNTSDKLVIFAGYGGKEVSEKNNRMMQFLSANPGISSRIRSTIYFDSYSPKDLAAIFERQAFLRGYSLEGCEPGRDNSGSRILTDVETWFETRVKDPNNGNGREVRNLLDSSIQAAAGRFLEELERRKGRKAKNKKEFPATLTALDVENAIEQTRKELGVRNINYRHRIGF